MTRRAAAAGLLALMLTGCAAPAGSPSDAPSSPIQEQTDMSTPDSSPTSPAEQAEDQTADQTAEVLLDRMFSDMAGVTELLGGEWTRNEKPFDLAMDRMELNPAPCRSGDLAGADAMDGPLKFQVILHGAGHAEPDATLDEVAQWAEAEGYSETRRGKGSMPQDGDRFMALHQADGTLMTVHVSTERTKIGSYTACSEHSSLQEYRADPNNLTVPGNRFKKTETPTPSPSSTKLGVSG